MFRRLIPLTACAVLAFVTALPATAQDLDKASVKSVQVADGIFMLRGAGGNIGLSVGDDGALIIDDEYAGLNDKVRAAIGEITERPVRLVLNTHWHGDHTGGNESFGRTGAVIVAHDNVRVRMSREHFSEFFGSKTPASPAIALPIVTFAEAVTLHLNDQTIHVEHVPPAHTDGDAIIWFESRRVVHTGDIFFNGFYPFIDTSSGGSIRGMVAAADSVLARIDDRWRVIPGHGPLSDRAGLLRFRNMLASVADRISAMIDEGMTVEEVIAAKPTEQFDEQWGGGFIPPDRWVRLVYAGLAGS